MRANRPKLYGLACASAFLLAACGGGGGYSGSPFVPGAGSGMGTGTATGMGPTTGMSYAATNLVSDLSAANNLYGSSSSDARLVKAWGVAFNPKGFAWVANNG